VYLDIDIPLQDRPEPPRSYLMRRFIPPKILSLAFLEKYFKCLSRLPRFEGIIVHLRKIPDGLARIQTLRDLLLEFRNTGKKVIIYSKNYSFWSYYVATAADEIYLQPAGVMDIIGLQLSRYFFKDALDKRGYLVDSVPISPFKSALDMGTRKDISKEDREQYQALLDSAFDVAVAGFCEFTKKKKNKIEEIINKAPHTPTEAAKLGLITKVVNEEEVIPELLSKKKGAGLKMVTWQKSLKILEIPHPPSIRNSIALICLEGAIIDGKSRKPPINLPIPILGGPQAGDQTIVQQVRKASRDRRVKAIVFHVNSGGGSATASEAIRQSLKEFGKKKPVVVYFSDVAASGGYYVATSSNWVVSQPLTLTGSIGVINGKFVLKEGLKKQGINIVYLRKGDRSGIYSSDQTFSEEERERIIFHVRSIYDLFLDHVAEFRKMEINQFEKYCRGRVWSGKDAHKLGLVDSLGNLQDAVRKATELAGIKYEDCRVVDIYKSESEIPFWINDGKIELSLEEWINPIIKEKILLLLPEKIEIE
jgi:protease-4